MANPNPNPSTRFQEGNPGRPVGSRSVETLFRDAIAKIAKDQSVEDVERELVITLLAKAKKGDIKALDMYLDRLYGKPKQHTDITTNGESITGYNLLNDLQSGKLGREDAYSLLQKSKE